MAISRRLQFSCGRPLPTRPYQGHPGAAITTRKAAAGGGSLGGGSSPRRASRPPRASGRRRRRVGGPRRPACPAPCALRGAVMPHPGWCHACDGGCRRRRRPLLGPWPLSDLPADLGRERLRSQSRSAYTLHHLGMTVRGVARVLPPSAPALAVSCLDTDAGRRALLTQPCPPQHACYPCPHANEHAPRAAATSPRRP